MSTGIVAKPATPAERPARREEIRGGSVTGPWRGGAKSAPPANVFVPTWSSAPLGEELRAPKLRKGGLAVIEPAAAEPAAEQAPAASADWTAPAPAPVEDHPGIAWDTAIPHAPAAGPDAAYPSAATLGAPDRLSAPKPAAAAPGSAGWAPAAAAPERSRRSVVLACVVGAAIAAAIVALAFTFRPAPDTTPGPAPDAPASVPAQ